MFLGWSNETKLFFKIKEWKLRYANRLVVSVQLLDRTNLPVREFPPLRSSAPSFFTCLQSLSFHRLADLAELWGRYELKCAKISSTSE